MKALLAFLVAFTSYVLVDIHIWQRIFETNEAWNFADQYHFGWKIMFWGLVLLGFILLLPDWKSSLIYSFTMWVTSVNGTEDLFYYLLDGRGLPLHLHWLDSSTKIWIKPVTSENLVINVLIQSILLLFLWIWYASLRKTSAP